MRRVASSKLKSHGFDTEMARRYDVHDEKWQRRHIGVVDVRDWPMWMGHVHKLSNLKRVSRARHTGDRDWQFPRELARIIIGYAREPKTIFIDSDGNCPMCDLDGEPEWPCEWHDDPHPNPDYLHIRIRDLVIKVYDRKGPTRIAR